MFPPACFLRPILVFSLTVLIWGCATGPTSHRGPVDGAAVGHMLLVVVSEDTKAVSTLDEITAQVAGHLKEWGYPVTSDSSARVSHRLVATIGSAKRGSTPVGLSFTAGHSDPRAENFQKADIMQVTYTLAAIANSAESADYTMEFIAKRQSELEQRARLIDHAGTVCINLLKALSVKSNTSTARPESAKPAWTPEVLIDVIEEPQENAQPDPAEEARSTTGLHVEKKSHKQITIHNQGSPIILKLGHERQ